MNWPWRAWTDDSTLKTERLRLVAITPEMMAAEESNLTTLAPLIGARLPQEWPPQHWEPHVLQFISSQLTEREETMGWHRYVLLPDSYGCGKTLIGCVGGFPKLDGDVEIGYSTLPGFQRQGFATEAASALTEWLLSRRGVRSVSAQTFLSLPESIKVMERCGMQYAGDGDEAGTVRYRRTR